MVQRILRRIYRLARQRLLGAGVVNFRGRGTLNLIDVGSAGDLPAPWYTHAPRIRHLLKFDPRDRPGRSRNVTSVDVALWEAEGERAFYVYGGDGSGSSLFPQHVEYVREHFETLRQRGPAHLAETWFARAQLLRTERIMCRPLDGILAELRHPFPYHFLKIDAQGAEYEILRGAERFLREHCRGLHLELFVVPLYRGIRLLPEVVAYLDGLGFTLARQFPAHGSFDSQHDCLFLRTGAEDDVTATIRSIYDLL